jgi:phosphomannomutase
MRNSDVVAGDDLIVSVSGIRGIVGRGLTPEIVTAFAAAFGTYARGGKIALCRDGRPSGEVLRHASLAGLLASGCEVVDLGISPTPTCGVAVRRLEAAGGLQITASHNPAQWNGLKLFGPDGAVLTADQGKEVQAIFDRRAFLRATWDSIGSCRDCLEARDWHRQRVLELVDTSRIRSSQRRVFLDANGGAGGPLGTKLLNALGCRVIGHGCEANGIFEHEPEPIAENLRDICPLVPQHQADMGLVLDPDADRLALVDETGRYIGEELTLALAVLFRLEQEKGPVVINMSTSRVVEDIARRFGCPCFRSAVGEANVVEKMRQVGAVIGGEGNGGVIDPRVGYVRDPFIGMALILNLLTQAGLSLSGCVASLPAYTIVKHKYPVERERLPAALTELEGCWPDASVSRLDGLRLEWPDRWIHVRPSNTEPVVRVIAEAPQGDDAEELCRKAAKILIADNR